VVGGALFRIELRGSAFTGPNPRSDPMLAGALRVTINEVVVTDADGYGLERSALGLLRSINRDHTREASIGFPTLLVHDCGFPWMACSNLWTDWTVRHADGHVLISDVRHFDSHPIARDLVFPEAACQMTEADDREPIVAFAQGVRDGYFADGDRTIDDEYERAEYEQFWAEFSELLTRHQA
jgi:hypothetical protein